MPARIIDILARRWPGRGFLISGEDLDTLVAPDDDDPLPTAEQIEAHRESVEAELVAEAELGPVPVSVTMSQFRRALRAAGIDPNIISASLAGDLDALDQWEYSAEVHRAHPLIAAMAAGLGKTSADVDAIFRHAGTL